MEFTREIDRSSYRRIHTRRIEVLYSAFGVFVLVLVKAACQAAVGYIDASCQVCWSDMLDLQP